MIEGPPFSSDRAASWLRATRIARGLVTLAIPLLSIGLLAPPHSANASYPGSNGLIAYTDLVDPDTPSERRAIFLAKQGQLTQPVARPAVGGANRSDNDRLPAWSPDGRLLAFVRTDGSGPSAIFVIQPDGLGLRRVFSTSRFQGSLATLQNVPIESIRWLANGRDIRLALVNRNPSYIVSGAHVGTDVGAVGDRNVHAGFDEGTTGTITGCPLSASDLCELIPGGGARVFDLQVDGSSVSVHNGFEWWPTKNLAVAAFRGSVAGDSRGQGLFKASWDPTTPAVLPRVERLTDASFITCVNPRTFATSTGARFVDGRPVPSPDGKFIAVVRSEFEYRYDTNQNCIYSEVARRVTVLRETGFQQAELESSPGIAEVAWQPEPANLVVEISDGHGNPLDALKVEIRDADDPQQIIDANPKRLLNGTYAFELLPGSYRIRAALEEAHVADGSPGAIRVVHGLAEGAPDAAYVDSPVQIEAGVRPPVHVLEFSADGEVLDSNLDESLWSRLDDLAAIYFQSHRFMSWARTNLVSVPISKVGLHAFVESVSLSPDRSIYLPEFSIVVMGTADSAYGARDDVYDENPVNGEWHELSHHLYSQLVLPTDCEGESHGGISNPDTCYSMQEGIAAFLATQVLRDPDYAGIFDLESAVKSWHLRWRGDGFMSFEDPAVAALYWDLVDDEVDTEITQAIAVPNGHQFVAYRDLVSIPLRDLWSTLVSRKPRTVSELRAALRLDQPSDSPTIDLDVDGVPDVSNFDIPFLMHGFFPFAVDQTISLTHLGFHFSIEDARASQVDSSTSRIGRTNRHRFNYLGVAGEEAIPRFDHPTDDRATIAVAVVDASGTPLRGADLEWTIEYPESTRVLRHSLPLDRASDPIPFDLPTHFDGLAEGDTIPPCNSLTDHIVEVTLRGSVNGYSSPDAPTFDNCAYLHAVASSTNPSALSLTLTFPEDSTAPITTSNAHSLATKRLYGPALGDYAVGTAQLGGPPIEASWTIELACDDPADGGFASGCARTEYSLDGAPFAPYESEFDIVTTGLHTLAVRSVDAAGIEEPVRIFRYGVVAGFESVPPVTVATSTASVPAVGNVTTGAWTLSVTCQDPSIGGVPGSGCLRTEYSVDGSAFEDYSTPVVVSTVGSHTFRYRSFDVLGNVEPIRQLTLVVAIAQPDINPPFTRIDLSGTGVTQIVDDLTIMGRITATLDSCVDPGVAGQLVSGCARTEYRVNGGSFQPFAEPITFDSPGSYSLVVRSVDGAGNVESEGAPYELTIVTPSDRDGDGLLDFGDNCDGVANPDQRDDDRDCLGNRCDPDFNFNLIVDSNDASLLRARLGRSAASEPAFDLDGDGMIGAGDTSILRAMFRLPPGPAYGLPLQTVNDWCQG